MSANPASTRRLILLAVLGGLTVIAAFAPIMMPHFYLTVLTQVFIFAFLAMSIDVMAGYTGLVPMGHAGIFGIASYVMGYLLTKTAIPMAAVVPIAVVAATLMSALFALLVIRTSGVYFFMITVAEGMIVWGLAYQWASVTNGENGISGIPRPSFATQDWQFYYLVLIVFVIIAVIMYRFVNSPFGLTLKGIRESEKRMRTLGYNTLLHKFIGFTASGFFASIGGVLYAMYNGFVSPSIVDYSQSAQGVLMTVVGGSGTLFGPIIGALIIVFVRNIVSIYISRWPTLMGLIFVVTIIFARDGLLGGGRRLARRIAESRRKRIASREEGGGTAAL